MYKLLIIGFIWPEPNSTAAGSRMLQLIRFFQSINYNITFVSTASKNDKSINLKELNIDIIQVELNHSSFDELLLKLNPSIILFDRFLTEEQFGWRVAKNCPKALRILDTEDLHFLRHGRYTALQEGKKPSTKYLINEIFKREIASIYRCDLSLIISRFEIDLLKNTFNVPETILLYLPFLCRAESLNRKTLPSFHQRKHFMTIGNFSHKPNLGAVIYLKEVIWPFIRKKLPKAKLNIYGAYLPEKIKHLHNEKEGFLLKGWAPDKEKAFLKARVCLAPLRFGAGLKGKLFDAMIYGTPSVTTKIGAEAMHDDLPWNGFIEDNPNKFAVKAVELYLNESIWIDSIINGKTILNQIFNQEKHTEILKNRLNEISFDLENHRLNNFMGKVLHHHLLQSTKYLSKWIEEKNK